MTNIHKKDVSDLKEIRLEVEFKDGTVIKVKDPKTLLLSYQNLDIKDGGDYETTKEEDIGGIQILGNGENLKFSLFVLLRQLVNTMGSHDVIDIFNRTMMYIAENNRIDAQLKQASKQKDKTLN